MNHETMYCNYPIFNVTMFILCSFPLLISYLDNHPYLFEIDPLLLHFLIHASPLKTYNELVTRVPLFIILAALTGKFSRNAKEEVCKATESINHCTDGIMYGLKLANCHFI